MDINGNIYEYINELYNKEFDRYIISYRKNGKYQRTYRAIWVRMVNNNKELPRGYCIHHKDHNRKNDVIDNLELLTRGEHNKKHANDENHYMFRKGHTYWNHPKNLEHKQKIKESHINRANKNREQLLQFAIKYIKDNPLCGFADVIRDSGGKSMGHFNRRFGIKFLDLKEKIQDGIF